MVDEELDLRFLLLCAYSLECVGSDASAASGESFRIKFRCCDNSFGYFYGRYFYLFFLLAVICFESHVEIALLHFGNILVVGFHRVVATHFVRDSLVVAFYLLTLECCSLSLCYLSVAVAQFGNNCYDSYLFQIFLGESTVDSYGHLSAF